MSATNIALKAHEQALAAVEAERRAEEARKTKEARLEAERHRDDYRWALPTLNEWFPGVEWKWYPAGGYSFDTILMEHDAPWSDPLKIKVQRTLLDMNEGPSAGYRVRLFCVERVQDTSEPGYSYWSGPEVKSAADVGHWLADRSA